MAPQKYISYQCSFDWAALDNYIYTTNSSAKTGNVISNQLIKRRIYSETIVVICNTLTVAPIYRSMPSLSISSSMNSTSSSVTAWLEMIERKKFGLSSSGW